LLNESTRHQFKQTYDVTHEGNWEGKTILNRLNYLEFDDANAEDTLRQCRQILLSARRQRTPPSWDDKTLTDWNALTVQAFARAAITLDRSDYLDIALQTMDQLTRTMHHGGRLYHSQRSGRLTGNATADDLAQLIAAQLSLYETTLDNTWITAAEALTQTMITGYSDPSTAAFSYVPTYTTDLPIRQVQWTDDVLPNANACMIINLYKLSQLTAKTNYTDRAEQIMQEFQPRMLSNAFSCPTAWIAWLTLASQPQTIITGERDHPKFDALHTAALKQALPHTTIMYASDPAALPQHHPAYAKDNGNTPTVYRCENQTCSLPITDPAELIA